MTDADRELYEAARAIVEAWDALGRHDPGPIVEWQRMMRRLKIAVEQAESTARGSREWAL